MGRPATGQTPLRNVRISDEIWHRAKARAQLREETLTAVIERALKRYGAARPGEPADVEIPEPTPRKAR